MKCLSAVAVLALTASLPATADAHPLGDGLSWNKIVGAPTDSCLGPAFATRIAPHETLSATSSDGRVYWGVMIGNRGLETAACTRDQNDARQIHFEMDWRSGEIKGDLANAAFKSLQRAMRKLVSDPAGGMDPSRSKQYLAEVKRLRADLVRKFPTIVAEERRSNPDFPKNTPIIPPLPVD
jgi:hypothetical protein